MAFISIEIVQAWRPHMTKFIRIWLGEFDGFPRVDRDGQNGHPARLQDSTDFRYGFMIIGNMFQDMRCKDKIIRMIVEWKALEVHDVIGPFHLQIGSFISTKTLQEKLPKECFGSHVKHLQMVCLPIS